jgi:NAD(P)-dependent dehydrogenase (short-subunit alcohol dehydrogenase family)
MLFEAILFGLPLLLLYRAWQHFHPSNSIQPPRVVVITGCDSGFGFMAAMQLAARGYKVVAGCYTNEGVLRLQNVVSLAILCDVTKDKDVEKLVSGTVDVCTRSHALLWAVVNNAGIAPGGLVDWAALSAFRSAMEVNYFGTLSVIKHFLPMLKRSKYSRIINVSSMAGIGGFANGGAYCGT